MTLSRRGFVVGSVVGGGLAMSSTVAGVADAAASNGFGPLLADPNGIVDLPAGFTYKVLASSGVAGTGDVQPSTRLGIRDGLDDQGPVPGDPDGMASFFDPLTRRTLLVCNHELGGSAEVARRVPTTYKGRAVASYDEAVEACGGTTTLVLDEHMNVVEHYPSLAGTFNNCAGGPTPWGTWLSCEETTATVSEPHGYVIEVDPAGALTTGVPYKAMGRCAHEAAAVDPLTSDVFLTEDGGLGSLLYKFSPSDTSQRFGSLGNGGALFAMRVPKFDNFAQIIAVGTTLSGVEWVPCPTDPDVSDLQSQWAPTGTVTRGNKLEGCCFADGKLWFVSSFSALDGFAHSGQVFVYDPIAATVTQVARLARGGQAVPVGDGAIAQTILVGDPDNITPAPFDAALWCQDGGEGQCLVAVDSGATLAPVARNPGVGEWAGATFSADGRWLFANLQSRSLTVAITGPWPKSLTAHGGGWGLRRLTFPVAGAGLVAATAGVVALRRGRAN
jgi:uncharacterized protein